MSLESGQLVFVKDDIEGWLPATVGTTSGQGDDMSLELVHDGGRTEVRVCATCVCRVCVSCVFHLCVTCVLRMYVLRMCHVCVKCGWVLVCVYNMAQ